MALAAALGAKLSTVAAIIRRHGLKRTANGKARTYSRADAETVRDWLRPGRGSQTIAYYFRAIKQFCRWLVKDRRTPSNPLEHLSIEAPSADIRRDRRALMTRCGP
jgi:site-specific recombinase XerC